MPETDEQQKGSDHSLLRRFQVGDDDAATALYERYANRLLALARKKTAVKFRTRFDAEDVVQSVFRSFFRRARGGLYRVPEGGELWQLLLVLSLNKIRRLAIRHGAQKRDVHATVSQDAGDFDPAQVPEQTARDILKLVVEETIDKLPAKQQEIVRYRIDGYEITEIVDRVGRSKRTVERTLQSFRQRLASVIDEE